MTLDFNKANLAAKPLSVGLNNLIQQAAAREVEDRRVYLGASIVGHECLRAVQFDWQCDHV
jgi:hypothetical protein